MYIYIYIYLCVFIQLYIYICLSIYTLYALQPFCELSGYGLRVGYGHWGPAVLATVIPNGGQVMDGKSGRYMPCMYMNLVKKWVISP